MAPKAYIEEASEEQSDRPSHWRWWIDKPAIAALILYACGFIAQSAHLSGFRFLSTDLLDKTYLVAGFWCVSTFAVVYFVTYRPSVQASQAIPFDNRWLKHLPKHAREAYFIDSTARDAVRLVASIAILAAATTRGTLAGLIILALNFVLGQIDKRVDAVAWILWLRAIANIFAVFGFIYLDIMRVLPIALLAVAAIAIIGQAHSAIQDNLSPFAKVDLVFGCALWCFLFGKFVYPLIRHEYGGGELRPVHVRYIETAKKSTDGYESSLVLAPIIHANEQMIYLLEGNNVRFLKRENVVSISKAPSAFAWLDRLRE